MVVAAGSLGPEYVDRKSSSFMHHVSLAQTAVRYVFYFE
jgi:hypothetical protein